LALAWALPSRRATDAADTSAALTPDEAQQIGLDAYIYGQSLITTEVTL
jgi:hypothetical protein